MSQKSWHVVVAARDSSRGESVAQAVDAQSATNEDHRSAMGTKLGVGFAN